MIALGALAAKAALAVSPIGRWLKRIPRSVWIKIALVIAVLVGGFVAYRWHSNRVETMITAAEARGEARAYKAINEATAVVEKKSVVISTEIRSKAVEENRRTAERADTLRVSGPGKAAYQCKPVAGVSTGGPVAASQATDVPMAGVPGETRLDLIVVPFAELVAFAEQHDLNRTEVLSWRENQLKQTQLIEQLNK